MLAVLEKRFLEMISCRSDSSVFVLNVSGCSGFDDDDAAASRDVDLDACMDRGTSKTESLKKKI